MERLVFNHIYPVVSPQINSAQHGFMKHRSTTTQLIDTYSDISKNLDSGSQTDIIVLDFAKAFDSVPHDLIVHKLKTFGFECCIVLSVWLEFRPETVSDTVRSRPTSLYMITLVMI